MWFYIICEVQVGRYPVSSYSTVREYGDWGVLLFLLPVVDYRSHIIVIEFKPLLFQICRFIYGEYMNIYIYWARRIASSSVVVIYIQFCTQIAALYLYMNKYKLWTIRRIYDDIIVMQGKTSHNTVYRNDVIKYKLGVLLEIGFSFTKKKISTKHNNLFAFWFAAHIASFCGHHYAATDWGSGSGYIWNFSFFLFLLVFC